MYLLKLFRDWYDKNVAEFDREGLTREVIAQKSFIAGFYSKHQDIDTLQIDEIREMFRNEDGTCKLSRSDVVRIAEKLAGREGM